MMKLIVRVSVLTHSKSRFGGLQYPIERPGHEDILHRRHQDQGQGNAESCHYFCVDKAFIVRSIAVVDAIQCPTDDADNDDRAAKLRDAEDDVRNPEASVLIHVVVSLVRMVEKLVSCIMLDVGNDSKNKRYNICSVSSKLREAANPYNSCHRD